MAADGGGGGMKKEEGLFGESNKIKLILPQNDHNINNNNSSRSGGGGGIISIAARRAAKCGFNASNINSDPAPLSPHLPSPCFTMPSGISPSALLDSPVMLPNAQAQLSPTTGTFQFPSPNHDQSFNLKLKIATNGNQTIAIDHSSSKLHTPLFDEAEYSKGDVQEMSKRECLENKVAKTQVLGHNKSNSCMEAAVVSNIIINSGNNNDNQIMSKMSRNSNSVQELISESTVHHNPNHHQEKVNKGGGGLSSSSPYIVAKEMQAKYSEDGFFWRKYGQKHVKGSEFPRSYYRCTDTNCDVRKKVECSQDGQITEIVYKGSHNHPKPHNSSSGGAPDQGDAFIPDDNGGPLSFLNDFKDPQPRLMSMLEPSTTFCIQDGGGGGDDADQNGASPDTISLNDEDDDQNAECDQPKKRKRESVVPNETVVPRSTREPKVVVQIESDIDILDDGYKWRKYGQKVVKGNPNPRSYYKCTTPNCSVRKHVERAAEDIKSVITTYEGKHNHHVPCTTKTTNHPNSDAAAAAAINNNNINNNDAPIPKSGNKVDLPSLFNMEAKANLNNYGNEMMNPNMPPPAGNFCAGTSSSSSSSVYQPAVSLHPYNSMHYSSYMRNSSYGMNSMNYSSKLCPTYPDYMQLHYSQMNNINHISAPGTNHHHHQQQHVLLAATNYYHNNNYPTMQTPTRGQEQSRDNCQSKTVKPKEEPKG
ncbi:hypothetical protein ABFS83_06G204900 [Erythranthe nasuta]